MDRLKKGSIMTGTEQMCMPYICSFIREPALPINISLVTSSISYGSHGDDIIILELPMCIYGSDVTFVYKLKLDTEKRYIGTVKYA